MCLRTGSWSKTWMWLNLVQCSFLLEFMRNFSGVDSNKFFQKHSAFTHSNPIKYETATTKVQNPDYNSYFEYKYWKWVMQFFCVFLFSEWYFWISKTWQTICNTELKASLVLAVIVFSKRCHDHKIALLPKCRGEQKYCDLLKVYSASVVNPGKSNINRKFYFLFFSG